MARTILVVDDETPMRDAMARYFTRKGYNVIAAEDAAEALEKLQRTSVQVAFLDLNLPGTNGVELCRQIKAANPIACVFAVTGHRSLFELNDCREAGFEDYFTKPVEMALLAEAAEHAFKRLERWKSL